MKPETLDALDNLCIAIGDVASLLLPNCVGESDRTSVAVLRDCALELRAALGGEPDMPKAKVTR